jgi:hypothetical protein
MLRTLRDKEEIKKYMCEEDSKKKCSYKSCLVQTQLIYDRLTAEYEAASTREINLRKELQRRLEESSGEKKKGAKEEV